MEENGKKFVGMKTNREKNQQSECKGWKTRQFWLYCHGKSGRGQNWPPWLPFNTTAMLCRSNTFIHFLLGLYYYMYMYIVHHFFGWWILHPRVLRFRLSYSTTIKLPFIFSNTHYRSFSKNSMLQFRELVIISSKS